MKHTNFFSIVEVLSKGIDKCPKCKKNQLNYEIIGRRIYCLSCDIKTKKPDAFEKREIQRYHKFIYSEFAGKRDGKFVSRVIWEDVWR